MFTGKFKVGDVVVRKDGKRFSDTNSPTEVICGVGRPYYTVSGQGGHFTEDFLELKDNKVIKDANGVELNIGDTVRRVSGYNFGNGKPENTIERWFDLLDGGKAPYVQNGWVSSGNLVKVNTSPVKETTVVKKEIVPGTYSHVFVEPLNRKVMMHYVQTKSQLAEAIKTLQLIHDAMESN